MSYDRIIINILLQYLTQLIDLRCWWLYIFIYLLWL